MIVEDKIRSEVLDFVTKKDWKVIHCQYLDYRDNAEKNFWIEHNQENFLQYITPHCPNELTEDNIEIRKKEDKIQIVQPSSTVTITQADENVKEYFKALDNEPCLINDTPDRTQYFEPYSDLFDLLDEADIYSQEIIEDFESIDIAEYKEYNGNWQDRYSVFYENNINDFQEEIGKWCKNNFDKVFSNLEDEYDRNEFELWLIDELEVFTKEELENKIKEDYPEYYQENYK